jgi:leucyl aminopeptidase
MMWSWETTAKSRDREESVEWIILPAGTKPESVTQHVPNRKRWDSGALGQIRSACQGEKEPPSTIAVRFSDGGLAVLLIVDFSKPKAAWHEKLRDGVNQLTTICGGDKALAALGVRWILNALEREQQRDVLKAAAFIGETRAWKPIRFGKEATRKSSNSARIPMRVLSSLSAEALGELIHQGQALGRANNQVRTWAALPFNKLGPAAFREELRTFARKHGFAFQFMGRRELERLKAGSFLAVLQADPRSEGGMAKLSYRPKGAKGAPIVFVGKGLCYDTGGYNVKPGGSMLGMHRDMTGAAVAASLLGYLAESKFKKPVDVYCAIAANLISETAVTPNQVVTALDGTAIEIVDTDAEGRLVLADTLAWVRKQNPRLVVDFATLTGSVIRALGNKRAGVFSNRDELARLAVQAGDQAGERTWNFPIEEEYGAALESQVSDILQCSENNFCDHIYAATFLSRFVGKETPWVHVDIAGPEHVSGGLGLISSEYTGFGILWAERFLNLHEE